MVCRASFVPTHSSEASPPTSSVSSSIALYASLPPLCYDICGAEFSSNLLTRKVFAQRYDSLHTQAFGGIDSTNTRCPITDDGICITCLDICHTAAWCSAHMSSESVIYEANVLSE
ncbi:MAG: hypothetical protein ACTHKP_03765 [Nitrososphaeraceae archaeon]